MWRSLTTRCIGAGFALAAILACTVIPWNEAQAQRLPAVECDGDVCTISRADWEKLKEYHAAVRAFADAIQKKAEQDAMGIAALLGRLQSCMAILEERKT